MATNFEDLIFEEVGPDVGGASIEIDDAVDDGFLPSSNLNIDRDIIEANEVVIFISNCFPAANANHNPKGQNVLCECLFVLLCGLALNVTTEGWTKMHTADFLLVAVTNFQSIFENLRSKSYYFEKLFTHLPGKVFPAFFTAFIGRKKDSLMSAQFLGEQGAYSQIRSFS
jgi:hypothetical protein